MTVDFLSSLSSFYTSLPLNLTEITGLCLFFKKFPTAGYLLKKIILIKILWFVPVKWTSYPQHPLTYKGILEKVLFFFSFFLLFLPLGQHLDLRSFTEKRFLCVSQIQKSSEYWLMKFQKGFLTAFSSSKWIFTLKNIFSLGTVYMTPRFKVTVDKVVKNIPSSNNMVRF